MWQSPAMDAVAQWLDCVAGEVAGENPI